MSDETTHALSAARPFPGLRPFNFEDHEFFFGREDQAFELFRRLDRSRFIAVVGSSGSGKSSLLRAGLRPLIDAENAESTARAWSWVEMRPGDAPLSGLASALAALAPETGDPAADAGRRERFLFTLRQSRLGLGEVLDALGDAADGPMLLIVDQFEEVFRFGAGTGHGQRNESEKAGWREESILFVQHLLQAAREPGRAVHVMLTMRSDFIGDCARFQDLPEAVSASQFLVPSLTRDQREQVIRGPIDKAGATIESGLVERLLNDASDELDQLPVLQHGLQRLWEIAQPAPGGQRHLTRGQYEEIGGLAEALSRHANQILDELSADAIAVEQVFRALSEVDREGRATRRALPFAQLLAETGVEEPALRRVLDRLRDDDCSFLVPSLAAMPNLGLETRIDVGHEALLRRWDKISALPAEDVEGESRRGGWLWQEESDGQTYHALLALREGGRTLPLDQVEARWAWWNERPRTSAWAARYGGHIERVDTLFADSLEALAADRRRTASEQRRQRRLLAATAAGFVGALILAGLAGWQWEQAEVQRREAEVQRSEAVAARHEAETQKATAQTETKEANAQRERAESALNLATQTANSLIFDVVLKYRYTGMSAEVVKAILDRALELQNGLMAGGETSPDLRRSQAAALDETVDTLMTLGDAQKAMTSARQAHDIFVALLKIDPNNTLWQRDLSVSDNKVGDVLLAQGDLAGALASYQDGLALRKARVAKDPDNTEAQRDVSVSDNDVGNVLEAQGDLPGALAAYREDNTICRKLAQKDPDNTEAQRDLSISDEKVGDVLKAQGDLTGALAVYREDHTICTKLAQDNPGNTQYQTDLAVSDERLADMLKLQKDFAGALEQYEAEVAIAERLLQIDSANMTLPRVVFYPTMRIGEIEVAQNNLTAALATFEKGEKIALHLKRVNPTATLPGRDLAWAEDQLTATLGAIASQKLAALDAAGVLAADQQRLAVARQIYAVIPTDAAKTKLAIALGSVSWAEVISHRAQDALNAAQEALGLDSTLLFLQTNRAHALLLLGRFNDAKAIYLDNKDKKLPNGKIFADVVRDDFAEMRKFGIDTPDMKRIEVALTS